MFELYNGAKSYINPCFKAEVTILFFPLDFIHCFTNHTKDLINYGDL